MAEYPDIEPRTIYEDLMNILPKDSLFESIFERANNAVDPYTFALDIKENEAPYIVVMPSSTMEVSELMKYATKKKIPVFVRGSGTSLQGASRYRKKGIVLNTSRLNHLIIEEKQGYAEFGPGHRVLNVREELEKKGYFLPLVPGSTRVASIGGIISNNTSAHVVDACIGKPRDYVLGLEVVLPTGEILETGSHSLRRPAGTDMTQYFVGGDGILGIITSIRMRLIPAFESAYGIAFFDDPFRLAQAVQRIYLEKAPPPLFLELLDKRTAEIAFKIQGLPSPSGPLILFHAIGMNQKEAKSKIRSLLKVIKKESPIKAREVVEMDEWRKIWLARESALPFICQAGRGVFALSEIVSTVSDLVTCLNDAMNMSEGMPTLEKLGEPYLFGHIGALTLHPVFIIPVDWTSDEKAKVVDEMFLKEAIINTKYGTCGGEWGQFSRRSPFFIKRYGEHAIKLVRGIKRLFDPENILNPNVLPAP